MNERALPELVPVPDGALPIWVIYDHPKDYPDGYVLRCQFAMPGGVILADPTCWYADDPDKLRGILPPGLVHFPHQPGEDSVILESWL